MDETTETEFLEECARDTLILDQILRSKGYTVNEMLHLRRLRNSTMTWEEYYQTIKPHLTSSVNDDEQLGNDDEQLGNDELLNPKITVDQDSFKFLVLRESK